MSVIPDSFEIVREVVGKVRTQGRKTNYDAKRQRRKTNYDAKTKDELRHKNVKTRKKRYTTKRVPTRNEVKKKESARKDR